MARRGVEQALRARRALPAAVVLGAVLFVASPAAATTRLVDSDGMATVADCDAGAPGSAYTTIQAAITAATAGADTIRVCPGTYAELVTVNKSLVLQGPKSGVDARDPSRTGLPATEAVVVGTGSGSSETTAFDVSANNVTIDGFTAQGAGSSSTYGFEILIRPDTYGHLLENNIVQNAIAGLGLGSDFTTIRGNLFKQNNASGPISGTGIYTDQFQAGGAQTGVTIDSNSFLGNNNAAVLPGSTSPFSQSHFTISNNVLDGNGNGFLAFNLTDSTFTRNVVRASTGSQVVIGGNVANFTLTENTIQDGMTRGVRIGDFGGGGHNTGVTATCNSLSGNATSGLELNADEYDGALDARFNWWGSPSGPTIATNPAGVGQKIIDPDAHVTFAPFLTDATDGDPTTPGFQCAVPRASITDVTKAEGNSGTTAFDFRVTLTNPSPSPVTIGYATQDGTAVAGADYRAASDTLTFAPGEQTKIVRVRVVGDRAHEPNETFKVKLLSPSGAVIADGVGRGTIQNDDPLRISAKAAKLPGLADALKKGFRVFVTTNGPGQAAVDAKASGKVVAKGRAALRSAGTRSVLVKFTKNARKKLETRSKLKLALSVTLSDAAGHTGGARLTVTLRL